MSELRELLLQQQKELMDIVDLTTLSTKKAVEGSLRIAKHNGTIQYYHRMKENDKKEGIDETKENGGTYNTEKYIRRGDNELAFCLAQRDYDLRLLKSATRKLNLLRKFLDDYKPHELEEIYEKMNPYRKAIVIPKIISEAVFVEKWSRVEYRGKDFVEGVPELYTRKGERVRSKSEKIIADMLFSEKIPYRYEYPIVLKGIGTVYPDFTVLKVKERKEEYWEHMGMMGNMEYSEKALHKIDIYMRNKISPGDRLILTHETSKRPLETAVIERLIHTL